MFGLVYKGWCRGNEVAIKVPTRRKLTKQQFDAFLHEIDLMKRIHHPQTVMLMGACFDENDNKIFIGECGLSLSFPQTHTHTQRQTDRQTHTHIYHSLLLECVVEQMQ